MRGPWLPGNAVRAIGLLCTSSKERVECRKSNGYGFRIARGLAKLSRRCRLPASHSAYTAIKKGSFAMRIATVIGFTLAVGMYASLSTAWAQRDKPGFNAAHQQCAREARAKYPNGD